MERQVMIMSKFEGTVKSTGKDKDGRDFGWIRYEPGNNADDDEIWFEWKSNMGTVPAAGTTLTFTRVPHPEAGIRDDKKGTYIATDLTVKK